MKKFLLTTALALHTLSFLHAQHMEWLKSSVSNYSLNPGLPQHFISSSGNLVYTSKLDSSTQIYGHEIFGRQIIDCYSASGTLKWSFTLENTVYIKDIISDNSGNLFIAGKFMGTVYFNQADSLVNTGSGLDNNVFVASIDSTGTLRWKQNKSIQYGMFVEISTMAIDPAGNCWYAFQDFMTSHLILVDSAGQDILPVIFNGTRSISSMSFDQWGGMYFAGSAESGTFSSGSFSQPVPETYMMYVGRMSAGGNISWVHFAHDVTFQFPKVLATVNGNAFFGGTLMDSVSWGGVHFHRPQWVFDFFLTRVDSSGNFSNAVQVPLTPAISGDFMVAANRFMSTDSLGNFYIIGNVRGTIDWGSGVTSSSGQTSQEKTSIIAFDFNCIPQWSLTGGCNLTNVPFNLSYSSGALYFACAGQDTITFDTLSANGGNGYASVFGKINSSAVSTVFFPEMNKSAFFSPNPTASDIIINTESRSFPSIVTIFDNSGRPVLKKFLYDLNSYRINLDNFISGIYLIRLITPKNTVTGKLIKQ